VSGEFRLSTGKTGGHTRIISASPAVTEILFALNAGDRIVGNTTYCDFPEDAKTKPKIGEYMPTTISIEMIVSLKPDIVFIDGGVQKPLGDSLAKVGISAWPVTMDSIESLKFEIDRIAKNLAIDPAPLLTRLRDEEDAVVRRVGDRKKPSVFIMLGGTALFTTGPNTVMHDIVTLAGGTNVFADGKQPFFSISDEELIKRNPDVILVPRPKDPDALRKELLAKPGWKHLKAIQTDRLFFVNEDTLSRAGPRYVLALHELASLLHPDEAKK
jgi:iron complex transport system substrate-binding protein